MSTHAQPHPHRPTEAARLELTRLPAGTPLADVFARACELAADAIRVERVGVWLYAEAHTALRCVDLYERSTGEHSTGTTLRVADFPAYFAALAVRKAIPAELAALDPRTSELAGYLVPLGITSLLDAGIFTGDGLAGVVCHEHVGPPREWTTEERDFAGSVADLLALRLGAAEVGELRAVCRDQQERLAGAERAAALQHLAAGVAHDFRNLLTVVNGHAEVLADRPDLPADARAQAGHILDAGRRGVAVGNELLEFARPDTRPPAVLDLAAVTADFLPVLRAAVGPRHPVRFTPPAAVGQVLADQTDVIRVLLNLGLNARDALPDGGPVAVRVAPVKVAGGPGLTGHFVMVEVADGGAGMDAETRRRAFDPFFTTKPKGTGLGLAVVRRAVERAGGVVRIETAPGKGTAVRCFFPRVGASSGGTTDFRVPPELAAPR